MTQDEIIEMAREAGYRFADDTDQRMANHGQWQRNLLVAFAKLVAEKATEEANARANSSWTLMCKKMVEAEREACAKECEHTALRMGSEWMAAHCAEAIRARGGNQ
jgi:hypothetical protein